MNDPKHLQRWTLALLRSALTVRSSLLPMVPLNVLRGFLPPPKPFVMHVNITPISGASK